MKIILLHFYCLLIFNACALSNKNINKDSTTTNTTEQLQDFYLKQNFEVLKQVERAEVYIIKDHLILGTTNEYYKKNILFAKLDKTKTKILQQLLLNTNNYNFSQLQNANYNPQVMIILFNSNNESISILYDDKTKIFSTISLNGQKLTHIKKKLQLYFKQYIL